jgi:hypothetical protein
MLGDRPQVGVAGRQFRPSFFIQLRCMKAFLPAPPNQEVERYLRGSSAMSASEIVFY